MDEVILQSGEIISKWEYNDIMKRKEIATETISRQLEEETKNLTYKGLKNDRIKKLEKTLETIENFETKTGSELKYSLERIKKLGQIDYEIKKAQTFRDNFMYALKEGASTFKNYKLLKRELGKIKNPKQLYDYISQTPILMDLFLWYDDETGHLKYGGFSKNEEAFGDALVKLGILEE